MARARANGMRGNVGRNARETSLVSVRECTVLAGWERGHGRLAGPAAVELRFGPAQGDVQFVECPDRLDLRMVLRHALAVEQARRAVVPGARSDGGHGLRVATSVKESGQRSSRCPAK